MGFFSHRIRRNQLKPGDHIYSWSRGFVFAHHGIYEGEGGVIHYNRTENGSKSNSFKSRSPDNPCPICGHVRSKARDVISTCLDCFLSGGKLYRYEYAVSRLSLVVKVRGGICTTAASDPPKAVLHRARYLLRNSFGRYNLFRNNCETFSLYCKTGRLVGGCGQAYSWISTTFAFIGHGSSAIFVAAAPVLPLGITLYILAVNIGCYCLSRFVHDINFHHVDKVPVEDLADRSRQARTIPGPSARPTPRPMPIPEYLAHSRPFPSAPHTSHYNSLHFNPLHFNPIPSR